MNTVLKKTFKRHLKLYHINYHITWTVKHQALCMHERDRDWDRSKHVGLSRGQLWWPDGMCARDNVHESEVVCVRERDSSWERERERERETMWFKAKSCRFLSKLPS